LAKELGLEGEYRVSWKLYLQYLFNGHVRLIDKSDEIIWSISPFGLYTCKLSFIFVMDDRVEVEQKWWQKEVWKEKWPPKEKLFMWCLIMKKAPT